MDKTSDEKFYSELDSHQQSVHCSKDLQPPYEFYQTGIGNAENGILSSLFAFLKNRNGGEVVAVIAIIMLSGVAKEFIRNKNNGFDSFAIIGCFVIASMIFALGLLAMLRATKFNNAKNTQEKQGEETQPGISSERTNKNGNPPG